MHINTVLSFWRYEAEILKQWNQKEEHLLTCQLFAKTGTLACNSSLSSPLFPSFSPAMSSTKQISQSKHCSVSCEAKQHNKTKSKLKTKGRERKSIYIAPLYTAFSLKALRHGSHSFTCKLHHACLSFVSIHQMAPPLNKWRTSHCSPLLIYRPREDERLRWPGWLTGPLTHIMNEWMVAGNTVWSLMACNFP